MGDMRTASTTKTIFLTAVLSLQCGVLLAQEAVPRSIIAVVGDADKFNIGQSDFCGERSDVASPSGKQFRIPSNKTSFFYIRTKFYSPTATHICEGDYSFTPVAGLLYIIRYTMTDRCTLEVFQSEPGGVPKSVSVNREESRGCLFK
jgi:hypothetical protein